MTVNCKIPDEYMGDVFMIMEFSKSFSKILQINKFFPHGLTLDLMERALTENEVGFFSKDRVVFNVSPAFMAGIFKGKQEKQNKTKNVHVFASFIV